MNTCLKHDCVAVYAGADCPICLLVIGLEAERQALARVQEALQAIMNRDNSQLDALEAEVAQMRKTNQRSMDDMTRDLIQYAGRPRI